MLVSREDAAAAAQVARRLHSSGLGFEVDEGGSAVERESRKSAMTDKKTKNTRSKLSSKLCSA